jgi:hypothetical protein
VKQSGLRPAGDVVARALEIGPGSSPAERTIRHHHGGQAQRQIDGASHWIPLDAPGRLNDLLFEWLG